MDPVLDQISRHDEVIKLEPRTMRLLVRLAETPGQVVSSRQLLDSVWSGVVVAPASVYQAVWQLRKLLGDTEPTPTYIATVPRKGYRLIASVERTTAVERQPEKEGNPSVEQPIAAVPPARIPEPRHRWALIVLALAAVAIKCGAHAQSWDTRSAVSRGGYPIGALPDPQSHLLRPSDPASHRRPVNQRSPCCRSSLARRMKRAGGGTSDQPELVRQRLSTQHDLLVISGGAFAFSRFAGPGVDVRQLAKCKFRGPRESSRRDQLRARTVADRGPAWRRACPFIAETVRRGSGRPSSAFFWPGVRGASGDAGR